MDEAGRDGATGGVPAQRVLGDGATGKVKAGLAFVGRPVAPSPPRPVVRWRSVLALLVAFLLGGWVLPHLKIEWRGGPDAADAVRAAPARPPLSLPAVDEPIARAAAAVSPAVVNIDTVSRVTVGTGDPFFDEVFGRRTVQRTGQGSGFIIDDQGHILTNEHVVEGANEITVTLASGRHLRGQVVGADRTSDVA